jgi:hypothetical protein
MPDPVELSRAVHPHGVARVAEVRTGRRFDLVGIEAPRARPLHAELRALTRRGWSRWAHAEPGQPVWAGGTSRVQVRVGRPVRGLRLRLINTTGSATAAQRARTRALAERRGAFGVAKVAARPAAAMPAIRSRASWGASRCKPRTTPSYGDVRVAYVHHTVSLNRYSRAQAASMVLGICLFHRNGNGWDDIGYNFLVDRYGRVWEGRSGGLDASVVGAQAGGFNSESTGVAMLGTFAGAPPPAAAMRALARLLAWKLSLHGVSALGRTRVTSAGGPSTGYPAGTRVTVNRISGHRDVDLTSCPGAALYRRLPALRRAVARLQRRGVSFLALGAPPPQPFGSGVTVAGRLTLPRGASPAGARIELRRLTGGREQVLATTSAAPDGSWSARLPALESTAPVRAVFAGDRGRPGVVSRAVYVGVVPAIDLTVSPPATSAGGTVVAEGGVRPAKERVTVTAFLRRPDGTERQAAQATASARSGSYRVSLVLDQPGTYRVVTTAPADGRSLAGSSRAVTVQVGP